MRKYYICALDCWFYDQKNVFHNFVQNYLIFDHYLRYSNESLKLNNYIPTSPIETEKLYLYPKLQLKVSKLSHMGTFFSQKVFTLLRSTCYKNWCSHFASLPFFAHFLFFFYIFHYPACFLFKYFSFVTTCFQIHMKMYKVRYVYIFQD